MGFEKERKPRRERQRLNPAEEQSRRILELSKNLTDEQRRRLEGIGMVIASGDGWCVRKG
jgi:hypothetical protein